MIKHSRCITVTPGEKQMITMLSERIVKDEIIYDLLKLNSIIQTIKNRHRLREVHRAKRDTIKNRESIKMWKEIKPKLRLVESL